jgi:hypothetical protein
LHDPHGRRKLADISDQEPLFLTERGTPYSTKAFYWHWYRLYEPLRSKCPVRFSPHDIRHLFISEYLIKLKRAYGAGTDRFQEIDYQQAREAFGSLIMGWSSSQTINLYDHTRTGEQTLFVLAGYQKDLAERRYEALPAGRPEQLITVEESPPIQEKVIATSSGEIVWLHDSETLAWIKKRHHAECCV